MGSLVEVARTAEVGAGSMKGIEVEGKRILIANVDGNFYAVSDVCGHQKARLSKGSLDGKTITCPLHGAQFDVESGQVLRGPQMMQLPGAESMPSELQEAMAKIGEIISDVDTEPLKTYKVSVEDGAIRVEV